jgi:hypothetical protein
MMKHLFARAIHRLLLGVAALLAAPSLAAADDDLTGGALVAHFSREHGARVWDLETGKTLHKVTISAE